MRRAGRRRSRCEDEAARDRFGDGEEAAVKGGSSREVEGRVGPAARGGAGECERHD